MDHFVPTNDSASEWAMSLDYYGYDALNRITGVWENKAAHNQGEASTGLTQQYLYDRYGNRTVNNAVSNFPGVFNLPFNVDQTNNRLLAPTGTVTYDLVGNQINDGYTGAGARTYDELNRIKSVTEAQLNSSGGWTFNLFTQNFNYDRWGNRTVSCSPCQPGVTGDVFTIDTTTNRITAKNGTGMTYDSAGNQTYDATGNRWFDGENRMHKAVQGGTTSHYVYDADGKRVRRIIGSTDTCSTETWMIYGKAELDSLLKDLRQMRVKK